MKRSSRPLINRLLSGSDGLAQADKEEVLARVLDRRGAKARWWSTPSFRVGALGLAASAAAAVVWVAQPRPEPEFTARGAATASFDLSCLADGAPTACREGSKVLFKVEAPAPGFFSAFTRTSDGAAVWYFSNVDTRQLPSGGVLDKALTLNAQPSGQLEVMGVFTTEPTDKSVLKERVERGARGLTVVRRRLSVEP